MDIACGFGQETAGTASRCRKESVDERGWGLSDPMLRSAWAVLTYDALKEAFESR